MAKTASVGPNRVKRTFVANDPVNHADPTGELDPSGPLGRALAKAAARAGAAEVVGLGPENPIANVAAAVFFVGTLAYELNSDQERPGEYFVRVQVQGTSVTNRSIALHDTKPISLRAVNLALTRLYNQASAVDKKELAPAFLDMSRKSKGIADAGGTPPRGYGEPGRSGDEAVSRVDIEAKVGERNIVRRLD